MVLIFLILGIISAVVAAVGLMIGLLGYTFAPAIIAAVVAIPFLLIYYMKIKPTLAIRGLSNEVKFSLSCFAYNNMHKFRSSEYKDYLSSTLGAFAQPKELNIKQEEYDEFFEKLEKAFNENHKEKWLPLPINRTIIEYPFENNGSYYYVELSRVGRKYLKKFGADLHIIFSIYRKEEDYDWQTKYEKYGIDFTPSIWEEIVAAQYLRQPEDEQIRIGNVLLDKEDRI